MYTCRRFAIHRALLFQGRGNSAAEARGATEEHEGSARAHDEEAARKRTIEKAKTTPQALPDINTHLAGDQWGITVSLLQHVKISSLEAMLFVVCCACYGS